MIGYKFARGEREKANIVTTLTSINNKTLQIRMSPAHTVIPE